MMFHLQLLDNKRHQVKVTGEGCEHN